MLKPEAQGSRGGSRTASELCVAVACGEASSAVYPKRKSSGCVLRLTNIFGASETCFLPSFGVPDVHLSRMRPRGEQRAVCVELGP
jgi:hypothetical protein